MSDETSIRHQWGQKALHWLSDYSYYSRLMFRLVVALPFIIAVGAAAGWSIISDWVFNE